MIVKIEFTFEEDTAYIMCPSKVGRNIRQLQRDFDRWIYDRNNDHSYWEVAHIDEDGEIYYGVCFDAEAFVYWLNNVRFIKGKQVARLIDKPLIKPKKKINF